MRHSLTMPLLAGLALSGCLLGAPRPHTALSARADMFLANAEGRGAPIGDIALSDSADGLTLMLNLRGLPPGTHGFHVHAGGSCAASPSPPGAPVPAGSAGSHFDPSNSARHEGPAGAGHIGDLPYIYVASDGTATLSLHAARLALADVRGRALVIHAGGDNYSDLPSPLGGGGARIACGVVD